MTTRSPSLSLRERTVGELAATMPGATAVFRKFKVDFCCGGDIALAEAARRRGVDADDVERELRALGAPDAAVPESWETGRLIDHLLTRYHETHRRELPELIALARKVEAVHVDHPQAPRGLADLLGRMQGELEVHMKKEELILFPAMRRRAGGGLGAPIAEMREDHADHGEHLQRMQDITRGFVLPEEACRSWQALYLGAAKFADDLMEHIHLENNVLFPRHQGA
jgi:regulator of cell morphogenesis and NO signaling